MTPRAPFDRVLKFGGAALGDGPRVERACTIVQRYGGERPVVVVSAHEGVTSLLEDLARSAADGEVAAARVRIRHRSILSQLGLDPELLDRYQRDLARLLEAVRARRRLLPGERDFVLSFGERMSARVVAHALRGRGVLATPVDAFDVGLTTDSNHGQARPLPGIQGRVRSALEEVPGVPVVTGFLAKDSRGNLTTLGRNGSDLTAALIAEAVGARDLCFWKTVGGVMTADPRLVERARVIERIGWEETAELAFHGAEVLHPAALAPVRRAHTRVQVRDARDPDAAGTRLVAEDEVGTSTGPIGIAHRDDVRRIEMEVGAPELRGARLADLFARLERHRVEPGLISADGARVSVTVAAGADLDGLSSELAEVRRDEVTVSDGLAQVALIGRGVGGDSELAHRALRICERARVDVVEAFLGERRSSQALLVGRGDLARAVGALHTELLGGAPSQSYTDQLV